MDTENTKQTERPRQRQVCGASKGYSRGKAWERLLFNARGLGLRENPR